MDILDIDEALKDDSFIFLEDKTHDDVSNILQQWKSNNSIQQQQQHQEQVYKLNSRTFTRPRRKLVQNPESRVTNPQQCNGSPMLNLEIGGLVTTMQKSFLQDTSPPASICSSMEVSIDRMNTSLITSADFINVNFLKSGSGHDFVNEHLSTALHFPTNAYTLSDMIRDRKALESLTLSGDGTLIKDCNIGQIDDISITLSKTASSCSTMDNSTESVEANNQTVEIFRETKCVHEAHVPKTNDEGLLHKAFVLSDEMIGDTTLNLIENSMYSNKLSDEVYDLARSSNKAEDVEAESKSANETYKKLIPLDETISLNKINCTFDCQPHTPETNCETPDADKNASGIKFYESTPQASGISHNKQQYTPSTKIVNDITISPIAAPNARLSATRVLSETFECDPKLKVNEKDKDSNEKIVDSMPQELLENVSNLNGTFNRSFPRLQQIEADVAMQNVMNLAQAEADILAENEDEEEFEQMLDEFSKIELNAEQLKMKKSLDSIKKRFTYGLTEKHERELSREAKDMQEILKTCADEQNYLERRYVNTDKNSTVVIRGNDLKQLRDTIKTLKQEKEMNASFPNTSNGEYKRDLKKTVFNAKESPNDSSTSPSTGSLPSTLSAMSGSGNGAERLLSRRSRLYDDINFTTVSAQARSPGASCKLLSNDDKDMVKEANGTITKNDVILQKSKISSCERMVEGSEIVTGTKNDASKNLEKNTRRFFEKRERDRDRFKTVEIVRKRTADAGEENVERLNVPCIDDMLVDHPEEADVYTEMVQPMQRFSRRDHTSPQPNDIQLNVDKERTATNINYLTYKKPKDKNVGKNLREVISTEEPSSIVAHSRLEPRSLSRPRYISGLQKFSMVSKATSAGDLEKTTEISGPGKQSNLPMTSVGVGTSKFSVNTLHFNRTQPNITDVSRGAKELKSPMGIKSKSFHNLSSNLGGGVSTQKTNLYGLRAKASNVARVLPENQKCDETVFKVPKLVSGIRAPSGIKRAGLVRPSSGYYSLNVPASSKSAPQPVDIDIDTDRHSPTDSMSSASSRNSVQSSGSGLKPLSSVQPTSVVTEYQLPTAPTKINTGGTGIPKPTGLRPPSNIKRSALPRPASILKR